MAGKSLQGKHFGKAVRERLEERLDQIALRLDLLPMADERNSSPAVWNQPESQKTGVLPPSSALNG